MCACGGATNAPITTSTVSSSATPRGTPVAPSSVVWREHPDCSDDELELLVPFLEGIHVTHPARALPKTGYATYALGYPGVIAAPFVAWRCGAKQSWSAVLVDSPDAGPVRLTIQTKSNGARPGTSLSLECFSTCAFRGVESTGSWQDVAHAVASVWNAPKGPAPLSSRYDRLHFYVHQWVADDAEKPLRLDFDRARLVARLAKESPRTIAFVYGLDPASVDLGGHYLWSDGAHATLAAARTANPAVAPYSWLNLRTYKTAIPAMHVAIETTPEVEAMKRIGDDGSPEITQYAFKAWEMCLGSAAWQESRMKELDSLIGEGYQVIALDEFPAPPHWDVSGCKATNHLHRPGDAVDEQRVTMQLIARLAARAREHGVMLSSEEPSLALLPYTSAYMDGAFNDPPDMYELWKKSPDVAIVPLFSTMFGDRITPTTRPDPRRDPPRGWMTMKKMVGD
jgi:hypothetical protein